MNSTLNFVIVLVVLIIIIRMSGSKRKDRFQSGNHQTQQMFKIMPSFAGWMFPLESLN
jgi:hypothetical protein